MEDRELIRLFFIEGKENHAFNLIIRKYSRRLYWHIRHLVLIHEDADDLLQETFIKVFRHLKDFEGRSSLYSWMHRIAINEALNHLKKKRAEASIEDHQELFNQLKADPYFEGDEEYVRLLEIIQDLPDKQKLVFQLKYFERMKYEEMAELLGGSIGSLKASYHHAVKKIEKKLSGN